MNVYAKALEFVTGCLSPHSLPGVVEVYREEIRNNLVKWEPIVALANEHLLVPALWVSLRDKTLDRDLPEDLRQYLLDFHKLNLERNARLKSQIEEAARRLNQIGIEPVLLKGAAHLFSDDFRDLGARMMTDIDILVREKHVAQSVTALMDIGYEQDEVFAKEYPDHHHWAPLFRKGDYAAIELHRRLLFSESEDALDGEAVWNSLEPVNHSGIKLWILNTDYRILHNIIHAEITDRSYYRAQFPLRSLHETAVLACSRGPDIDWGRMSDNLRSKRSRIVMDAYLYLLHKTFRIKIPGRIRANPQNFLHYLRNYANIRWRLVYQIDNKLQVYNAWEIKRRYRRKAKNYPVWRGRLRYTMHLLRKTMRFR